MRPITFVTSHPAKAAQLARRLHYPVVHVTLDLPEIQSLSVAEVVTMKAKEAYRMLQTTVLVEDFALSFETLGQLPGPLIKWFNQELGMDGLCRLLDTYPSRRAFAQTSFALCEQGSVTVFSGVLEGQIALFPQGDAAFYTDAIFIPSGCTKTWANMTEDEQAATSVRRIGLQKLAVYLRGQA